MHMFGATPFAAAVQSLPGGVFRRRSHLTALPGLHFNQMSANFCHKNPSISAVLTSAFPTNSALPPSRLQVIV